MTTQSPVPPWGDDLLSNFLSDAEYNTRAAAANFPTVFDLLREVHTTFVDIESFVETDTRDQILVPRFLFIRAHASFLAAVRLSLAGQLPESFAVQRVGIEQAWYALHIWRDPSGEGRVRTWLNRNDSVVTRDACKTVFTIRNVRASHEELDPIGAAKLKSTYDRLIDFGGHPNPLGVLGAVMHSETESGATFSVGILHAETTPLLLATKVAIEGAIGVLMILPLVYPERLKIMQIDRRIDRLVDTLNEVFRPFIPKE